MPLVAALRDDHDSVQRAAAEALGEIADERTIKLLVILLKDEHAWWAAMDALVRLGSPAVEPLVVALKDGDEAARGRAAQALGRIGDARAAGPLSAALEDTSWFVRQAAAEALGRIGSAQAVGSLLSLTAGEEVAETAVSALRLVLETAAPQIEPENLYTLADFNRRANVGGQERRGDMTSHCAEVRRLAQQELFRRGLK